MKIFLITLLLTTTAFAGLLQNEDFKTEAQLISAGGTKAQLLNNSKIYLIGTGETFDDALGVSIVTSSGTMTLTNKTLIGGSISGTTILNGSIIGSSITASGSVLSYPNITFANISGSSYTGGSVSGASILGGTISGTANTNGTFLNPVITGGSASGVALTGGSVSGATHTNGTFTNPTITGGSVSSTISNSVILTSSISASTFTNGTISGAAISLGTMSGTTITGGSISGTAISGVAFLSNIANFTGSATLTLSNDVVLASNTTVVFTLTLPSASAALTTGKVFSITNLPISGSVILAPQFGQTICGNTGGVKLIGKLDSMDFVSDGLNWQPKGKGCQRTIRGNMYTTNQSTSCTAGTCTNDNPILVTTRTGSGQYTHAIPPLVFSARPNGNFECFSSAGANLGMKMSNENASTNTATSYVFKTVNSNNNSLGDAACEWTLTGPM